MTSKNEFVGSIEHVYTYNSIYHDIPDVETVSEKINCTMQIYVELHIDSANKQSYVVVFKYVYNGTNYNENRVSKLLHPMYHNVEFMENDYNGNAIPVNDLTSALIKYLLTPIDKLNKYSGLMACYDYHVALLETFSVQSI
jgi:hypothetical protein